MSPTDWRAASDALEAAYQRSVTAAGVALYDRATPDAVATFAKAGIAGVLGLVAVIASLMVSYRVGRGLTRELAGLRGRPRSWRRYGCRRSWRSCAAANAWTWRPRPPR